MGGSAIVFAKLNELLVEPVGVDQRSTVCRREIAWYSSFSVERRAGDRTAILWLVIVHSEKVY